MIRHSTYVLVLVFLAFAATEATAACSLNEQRWLSYELPRLKSWNAIYKSFRRHVPQCDDGFIGEGYTEAVASLLAHRWELLPQLASIARRDAKFERFVLRHIDASADPNDLKLIQSHAASQCAPKIKVLCASIEAAVGEAIKAL